MLNFDSLSLNALIKEIAPILTSGRVQKVQQPSRHELVLVIRAQAKTQKLYICVDPKYPHVALLSKRGEELRSFETPQVPPMFCMLLRKHLEGAKINKVVQPGYERILEIEFDSYSELGAKVPMVLACEIMGKHSNIILYNYETNVILGCAHNVSSEKSRERELAGGLPYIYPPKQAKIDLRKISEQEFISLAKILDTPVDIWLNEKFGFISRALGNELCKACSIETENKIQAIPVEKLKCLYNLAIKTINLENFAPAISKDKKLYSLISLDSSIEWKRSDSANLMVDKYFGEQVFKDKFERLTVSLNSAIKKEIKKQKSLSAQYRKNIEADEKQEKYRQTADLIMANLYRIETGAEEIELENIYADGEKIKIKLNSGLTPNENAQRYYKLYNKAKNAAEHALELLAKIKKEAEYLESIKESINLAENLEDLKQVRQELIDYGLIKDKRPGSKNKKAPKEKIHLSKALSSDGFEIIVGKNNRQNDHLLKTALPEDIWLHAQNMPGSHVLIKTTQEAREVPETTLHEAVYLAAYYSQGRSSSNVPIVYTRKKFVKKPSGAKPGFVIYTHEKTLYVNPEEERVLELS